MTETRRTFLAGATVVLPDRVASDRTLVIEGDRIADIIPNGPRAIGDHEVRMDLEDALVVPGFIDVHVHGVLGDDALDGGGAVARIASRLPRYGVTAFCPTSIACAPDRLLTMLGEVGAARQTRDNLSARVLPAHLESNFLSPDYCGAQPRVCLRAPAQVEMPDEEFSAADILRVIDAHVADVGIVTLAPEINGGQALVRRLVGQGVRVSIGHSGATYNEANDAIAAGARHGTHLFNQMRPMAHRDPGLVGAVLSSEEIATEMICDGHHVHPAVMRVAIAAKTPSRLMAITDGTALSGMPRGSRGVLGGRPITAAEVARLDDGTVAGSVLTMDRAFACLVGQCNVDFVEAVQMCATTPARELGLQGHGVIAPGAVADLVILGAALDVRQTWIGGRPVWQAGTAAPSHS